MLMLTIKKKRKNGMYYLTFIYFYLFIHIYSLVQMQVLLVPASDVKPSSKQDNLDLLKEIQVP